MVCAVDVRQPCRAPQPGPLSLVRKQILHALRTFRQHLVSTWYVCQSGALHDVHDLNDVGLRAAVHIAPGLAVKWRRMPASQLRCEVYVTPENDRTGENAVECGAIALACTDCGDSAGCEEHALICPRCGKPVCDYCADEHACVAGADKAAA